MLQGIRRMVLHGFSSDADTLEPVAAVSMVGVRDILAQPVAMPVSIEMCQAAASWCWS